MQERREDQVAGAIVSDSDDVAGVYGWGGNAAGHSEETLAGRHCSRV